MIRPKQAKKILPKSEFEQFEAIIENQARRISDSRLKQKATISRRLRDKYRDLARHQSVAAKQKLTNETDVSHNEARAQIFHELIGRIEAELERPNRSRPADPVAVKRKAKRARRARSRDERDAAKEIREAKKRQVA